VTRIRDSLSAVPTVVRVGIAEFRATYTWRSWTFGWFLRLITQAIFFTSFGLLLRSAAAVSYLGIGNSVVLVCMEALAVIPIMNGQRHSGVLGLEAAAPSSFPLIYACRNIYCPCIGFVTSSISFFGISWFLGIRLVFPDAAFVPLVIAVVGLSTYAFGFALATAVMWKPSLQTVATNVSYLVLMTFCGTNVPVSFWPAPIRSIASVLPLTHGLLAIRGLARGAPAGAVWLSVLFEVLVGAGWLAAGFTMMNVAAAAGRRTGNLELSA
jgi:ABC-2 type transport system permease protein